MRATVYTCTRLGGTHESNQDRALVGSAVLETTDGVEQGDVDTPVVLGVFDGLGGHRAGDVASELVARFVADAPTPSDEDELGSLLHRADDALQDAMRADPARFGMGTTAAVLALPNGDGRALVANVGDSGVWRLRDGAIEELSVSDRWYGSAVLQCLGANDDAIAPHVSSNALRPGDRLLIATDGLTDVVPPDQLAGLLGSDPEEATARLVELVERAGTPDDLTFVLAEFAD